MTKADLIERVTSLGDLTRRDGEIIVETLFDSIVGALKDADKVEVRGFGSFRTRQRRSRTGRNPKTGASVAVPAKRVPFFKPSKEMRDLLNPAGEGSGRKTMSSTAKGAASRTADASAKHPVDPHHPPAM